MNLVEETTTESFSKFFVLRRGKLSCVGSQESVRSGRLIVATKFTSSEYALRVIMPVAYPADFPCHLFLLLSIGGALVEAVSLARALSRSGSRHCIRSTDRHRPVAPISADFMSHLNTIANIPHHPRSPLPPPPASPSPILE